MCSIFINCFDGRIKTSLFLCVNDISLGTANTMQRIVTKISSSLYMFLAYTLESWAGNMCIVATLEFCL